MIKQAPGSISIWGGIECTINRVEDRYMDQLLFSNHYHRGAADIAMFKELNIKALRYPALWEKHAPQVDTVIDWSFSEAQLNEITAAGIEPIAGLVHHGSGPAYADFMDGSFATGLKAYAAAFAKQFPFVTFYTPVNEPLTTARFCGLYGHWYPHKKDSLSFYKILLAECKGTVLAMQAIRAINPLAKLVQTEDLGKTHSTRRLKYQADFENCRRWLSFDLLCGKVNSSHPMWKEMTKEGIAPAELLFFVQNPCPPDVLGLNYYVTSERWLDQKISDYPAHCIGGNGTEVYADVEAVRAGKSQGAAALIKEAWQRYKIPVAITEVHLHCTREEQMRWFHHIWQVCNQLTKEGVEIKAITAWALLGSFDWCSLLTKDAGMYEPGIFDVRTATPRATALKKMVSTLASGNEYIHPVLQQQGWWSRPDGIIYKQGKTANGGRKRTFTKPLFIIGNNNALAKAFAKICEQRGIYFLQASAALCVDSNSSIEKLVDQHKPWAIINAADYTDIDNAQQYQLDCYHLNTLVPERLALLCAKLGIQFLSYSSNQVFDGKKNNPYVESDQVSPLNIYGKTKALAESCILKNDSTALVIRTSSVFGPWDRNNLVYQALSSLKKKQSFTAPYDMILSPTYMPDLVNTSLDLLLDEACGIWNISNKGSVSWAALAGEIADRSGLNDTQLKAVSLSEMNFAAPRPLYSVLHTEKGFDLPSLDNALERFFKDQHLIAV